MNEHHIVVRKTARYYTLGPADAGELWFVIHGYSQLARRFLRKFQHLDDGSRCIVAPEALNRYYSEYAPGMHAPDARIGATWMTKEDRLVEIDDYVHYLDALYASFDAPRTRTVLLGFSQGVATAARWASRGDARFDRIAFWGSYLPDELDVRADTFGDAHVSFVYGRSDAFTPPATVAARLADARFAHDVHWFDGGHELDRATLLLL